jgi:hypothetical protein
VVLLIALVIAVVLLLRDSPADDQAGATTRATPTTEPTPSPTPSPTTSPSPSPTATQSPEPIEVPELRADGIGPLMLRMTADEALATGDVTREEVAGQVELIPDEQTYPGVFIGYDPVEDLITSFTVKDGSPIRTPDGIGIDSTGEDIRAAYGPLVQEQIDPDLGETWYLVQVDDVGYAFFPTAAELIMVAATDTVLATIGPGQGV